MRPCANCGKKMRSDRIGSHCRTCESVCACGKPKDFRAATCGSCSSRRTALEQWNSPLGDAMRVRIRETGLARRKRYADLTEASFTFHRKDGRSFAKYYDDEVERTRYVYRYRWIWERAHGPIPTGLQIHHKNEDPSDDRLENLELKTSTAHAKLHMTPERAQAARRANTKSPVQQGRLTIACASCGITFQHHAQNGRTPKYCSWPCKYEGARGRKT